MVFRKNASHGIWCTALLPIILWLEYVKKPVCSGNHDILIIMSSTLMFMSSLVIYGKHIFPAIIAIEQLRYSGAKSMGLCRYIVKQLFYDLFERKLSTVVRKLRQASSTISSKLQPSSMPESRRIRAYTKRIRKGSTSTSPLAPKLIPGEDRKRSLERKILGSGIEPIIESPALAQRKKSSLVEIIKGCIASNVSSPTHLLVPPDDEIYMFHIASITNIENKKFLNYSVVLMTSIITICGLTVFQDNFNIYYPLVIGISNFFFVKLLPKLLMSFKNQFSYGEGCLITQTCIVFVLSTLRNFIVASSEKKTSDTSLIHLISQCFLLTIILTASLPYIVPFPFTQMRKRIWYIASIGISVLINMWPWKIVGVNPIKFILEYAWLKASRIHLLLSWITMLTMIVSMHYVTRKSRSSHNTLGTHAGNKNITTKNLQIELKNTREKINDPGFIFVLLSCFSLHVFGLFIDINLTCLVSSFLLGTVYLFSYCNWIKIACTLDNNIESIVSKCNFLQHAPSREASDHYSDYLTDPEPDEVYMTQRSRQLKKSMNLLCNGLYAITNLVWPMWFMMKRMENVWHEDTSTHPPFFNLLGFLPICVGLPISFICNKRIKRKTHIHDTEETIESLIFAVLAQVVVFWLVKKGVEMARMLTLVEQDFLKITSMSEGKVLILCTSIALIQSFCTQSRYLVLCPILYIMCYFT